MTGAALYIDFNSPRMTKAHLSHGYLMIGPDKLNLLNQTLNSTKTILCQNNQTPFLEACGTCKSCLLFQSESHPDQIIISNTSASIGIDEIRQVTEFLTQTPSISDSQVVIIDGVENLTENASNALLKTLEEPPGNSYLFLLAKSTDGIMPTILSRCQLVNIEAKSKSALVEEYSDVPNYVVGFCNGAESDLIQWQQNNKIAEFEEVYSLFLLWLKGQSSNFVLLKSMVNDNILSSFLLYLLERRIRQLSFKQHSSAVLAMDLLTKFNHANSNVRGQNNKLALTSFLQRIEPLIR